MQEEFIPRTIGPVLLAAALLAALAIDVVPRRLAGRAQLAITDDPARIAELALDEKFNAGLAEREIEDAGNSRALRL